MARKTAKLERIESPEGNPLLGFSTEELLLHDDEVAAALEFRRRAWNKYVKKQAKS